MKWFVRPGGAAALAMKMHEQFILESPDATHTPFLVPYYPGPNPNNDIAP